MNLKLKIILVFIGIIIIGCLATGIFLINLFYYSEVEKKDVLLLLFYLLILKLLYLFNKSYSMLLFMMLAHQVLVCIYMNGKLISNQIIQMSL
jgi:hypothetical protein